jgi:hypothetical protein
MRRLLITLDDELDPWMARQANQSETVRNALNIYKGDISTDTIQGLRQSYTRLTKYMEDKFEYYDSVFKQLEKLISMLETRM